MAEAEEGGGRRRSAPRKPGAASRPMTAERIRAIAEFYVSQRESSAKMLRDALERRLARRLRALPPEEAEAEGLAARPLIAAEVERLAGLGIVEDARFAGMRARSGLARGRGARRILGELARKGVDGDTAGAALLAAAREAVDGEGGEDSEVLRASEAEAAETFARRRRLGPFRAGALPEDRAERARAWRREAAAMARAGFGPETIRRVLDRAPEGAGDGEE